MSDSLLDMVSLLDTATEEVANRPDFVSPEPGIYIEKYKGFREEQREATKDGKKFKKGDKYTSLVLQYEILETIEGGNPEAPIKPGSLTSENFILDAENLPSIKQRFAQIHGIEQSEFTGPFRDIMLAAENMLVKTQYTKRSGSDYTNKKIIDSLGVDESVE